MKKTIFNLFAVAIAVSLVSCGGDSSDDGTEPTPQLPTTYSGVISEDVTWTKDNVYTLASLSRCSIWSYTYH